MKPTILAFFTLLSVTLLLTAPELFVLAFVFAVLPTLFVIFVAMVVQAGLELAWRSVWQRRCLKPRVHNSLWLLQTVGVSLLTAVLILIWSLSPSSVVEGLSIVREGLSSHRHGLIIWPIAIATSIFNVAVSVNRMCPHCFRLSTRQRTGTDVVDEQYEKGTLVAKTLEIHHQCWCCEHQWTRQAHKHVIEK